jgi:glycosyltransferase involved in cell wall biosynthesis
VDKNHSQIDISGFGNRSQLRVLIVSPLPPPSGGIARQAVLLLGWLKDKPWITVRVVDISPRWRAVEDMKLWKRVVGGVLQGARDALKTLDKLVVFRPHLLHLHSSAQLRGPWDTVILAVSTLMGIRSLYSIHMGRLPDVMARKDWEWWGLRWALKLAHRVVVLDKESEEALKRFLPAERVVRLPNAIAVSPMEREGVLLEPLSVLYLGHVVQSKGMQELMEAWRKLRPRGWRLRLAGLGSAAYRNELEGIVGPAAGVEFLNDLSPERAWECMQAASIFILPSYTEGFPNVILEAMAAGKAIIGTRVGAIPEMLDADKNEACGMVIIPRDSFALAAALHDLMDDPKRREVLGRRALAKAQRSYTTDVVYGRLLALWDDVSNRLD